MVAQALFQSLLVLHLTGFALFAGSTVTDCITFRQLRKQYEQVPGAAQPILQAMSKFPVLMGIGILLAILAGVGMMVLTRGAFGEQLWLRIKFPLVIIAALNGIIVRRRQGTKLQQILTIAESAAGMAMAKVKSNLTLFYIVQLSLCFVILLLSVFKFN